VKGEVDLDTLNFNGFSVVIAAYNGAGTIQETIASCLDQSFLPAEVIIVDDHSTDETLKIVREIRSLDVPVRILQTPRNSGGPAQPFNVGIAAASCDLVALLEQDDIWHRDKLLSLKKAFEIFPDSELAYADPRAFEKDILDRTIRLDENGPAVERVPRDEGVRKALNSQFTLTISNMVLKKSSWKRAGGFPEDFRISTDYAFLARLLRSGCHIIHIPQVLVHYRVHPKSVWLTSNYSRRHYEKYVIMELLCGLAKGSDEARVKSRHLAEEMFDTGFLAAKSGQVGPAIFFYLWSLKHRAPLGKVVRSVGRVLLKGLFGREYQ
jgi:glycosyltransferase involved in cell wall biosynthesis